MTTATSTQTSKRFHRPELDGLRCLAVMGVLIFHINPSRLEGGFLGVDVFFVLSGFLITGLLQKSMAASTFSFKDFYIRRMRRLFPAMFATVILGLIIGAFILSPTHYEAAAESGLYGTLSVVNIHFWLSSGYFDLSGVVKPFLHFWSLSVEEQFYLLWPVILFLFMGKLKSSKIAILVIGLISALSLAACFMLQTRHFDAVFYLMPFRIWEFGAGALIALLGFGANRNYNSKPVSLASLATLVGVILIVLSFVFSEQISNFALSLLIPVVGASLIILSPLNWLSKYLLANKLFVFLGKISYSLYLFHWPVIVYFKYIFGNELNPAQMLIVLAICLVLGALSYFFIENKFRHQWTETLRMDRFAVPAVLAPMALVIVTVTSHIWAQKGWSWRLSEEAREAIETGQKSNPNCDDREFNQASEPLCVFGAQEEKIHFAIMGDSHASALAGGMVKTMQANKITGISFLKAGTPALINTQFFKVGEGERGTLNQNFEDVFATKPKYLILHSRHSFYWHTKAAENISKSRPIYLGPKSGKYGHSIDETRVHFERGFKETLDAIKKEGIIPIVVGPIPNPGMNTQICISRLNIRAAEAGLENCGGFTKERSIERNQGVMNVLSRVSREQDVVFIDPTPIFCKKEHEACLRDLKGKLIYRDNNHLTLVGASLLSKEVFKHIE